MGRALRAGGVILAIAASTRLAMANDVVAAVLAGSLGVVAVGIGMAANTRCHRSRWRRAWFLLWLAIVSRVAGTVMEVVGQQGSDGFPSGVHLLHGLGAVLALVGVDQLVRHRHPGRASDVLFEAVLTSTLLSVALWLLVVEPRTDASVDELPILFAVAVAGIGLATLWVVVRLIWLTDEHPVAYRYVAAGLLCLVTVDAVVAGGLIEGAGFDDRYRSALSLWGYVLWGVAALHPSMRSSFEPVPYGATDLRPARVAFVVSAALLGPALLVVQTARGVDIGVVSELVAAVLVPLLVTIEMVRQVRERATREYLAQHDALTGLPNRVLFYDRLETALAHARRSDRRVGVMFLDLDRFKEVNDSLGHDVGNQLLQGVARRLRRCLREQDSVARLGGDEFTILLTDLDDAEACGVVAEKVLRAFSEPFPVTGRDLFAATSIGVAVFPDDGVDADTLMKNADTAMYRAKANGRSGFEFYTRDMSTRAEVRHSLEGSLHRAIQRGELTLHYQPKVRRMDRSLTGVEALVRWNHPRLGSIPPSAFVPLAEESGLILPLGEWVLEEACRQAASWSLSRSEPIPVAVNVSARQFMHEPLEHVVQRVLDDTGLDPRLLELELTESVFLRDINAVNLTMHRLHDMGVRCSIDDFGTGFSGLSYLSRMPIDTVKIDGSFVNEIRTDHPAPLLSAMIAMAKSLDLGVVAEGVETEEQAEFLLGQGCEQMQGYLFSRPLPVDELEQLLMLQEGTARAGAPAASSTAALAAGAITGLDPAVVIGLLEAACSDGKPLQVDAELVQMVLDALHDPQLLPAQWGSHSLPVRLAAGTFAGLLPLSGGLLAADLLPAGAQRYATMAFANLGVELPHLEAPGSPVTGGVDVFDAPLPSPGSASDMTQIAMAPIERRAGAVPRLMDGGADPLPVDQVAIGEPHAASPSAPTGSPPSAAPSAPRPTPPAGGGSGRPPHAGPSPDHQPGPVSGPQGPAPGSPGQDHTPPGQGETPPGQDGSPPDEGHTPPGQEHVPPGQEQVPPGQEQIPPGQEHTPPGQDQIPPGQEHTPPGQEHTPPGQEHVPPGQEHTPPGQEQTPPGQEQTPPGQEQTPPGQEQTPPGQEHTPPGQEHVPPGQEQTPPGQEHTPPGQEQTPRGQGENGRGRQRAVETGASV